MNPNSALDALAAEHRTWLSRPGLDLQYLRNWTKLYNADYEAAMTEAAVRRLLERQNVVVEPNESLTGASQAPDYRCWSAGRKFYVEVTCISIVKATKETGISEVRPLQVSHYGLLTNSIFCACQRKAMQCDKLDAPALVAIGTFHSFASMVCFGKTKISMVLTGTTSFSWTINLTKGTPVGDPYQSTELRSAAFLKPDPTQTIGFARNSISGLLLCGAGDGSVIGVLHPNPALPFDPAALPNIEFGTVEIDQNSGQLDVRWPENDDD